MYLPNKAAPVIRFAARDSRLNAHAEITPSQMGYCVDNKGELIGNGPQFNQAACCARRDVQGGGYWINQADRSTVYC